MNATTTSRPAVPPGPRGLPIVGNALQMGSGDVLDRYVAMQSQYGDIVHLKLGPMDGYVLFNPEDVHHVLVKNAKNFIKGIGYDGFRLLVGNGLVTSDGDFWRQQRRMMQPSFTPRAITQFSEMMAQVTDELLDGWFKYAQSGEPFFMDDEMLRLTMSVIGRAMFAIDLSQEMTEVGAALQEAFGFIPTRSTSIVPLSVPLPAHQRFKKNLDLINRFVAERIEEGRRSATQDTLLSIMLHAQDEETGHRMTDEQLRDEVVTLFFAGFETTARSLTWGWSLLLRHPDALSRLEDEADRVIGLRRPTVEDLFNLKWTRQVIDETLRLYPPTALLARQASEDDVIGGYPVKAGAMIILVPYIVHRHRDFWDNADMFDPERFTPEADAARIKSAYIPFASGPRVCLGNNFALLEMVYAYSMAAARYHVEAVDESEIAHEFGGTIRPTRRLSVRVRER